jgi:hypothetical protein
MQRRRLLFSLLLASSLGLPIATPYEVFAWGPKHVLKHLIPGGTDRHYQDEKAGTVGSGERNPLPTIPSTESASQSANGAPSTGGLSDDLSPAPVIPANTKHRPASDVTEGAAAGDDFAPPSRKNNTDRKRSRRHRGDRSKTASDSNDKVAGFDFHSDPTDEAVTDQLSKKAESLSHLVHSLNQRADELSRQADILSKQANALKEGKHQKKHRKDKDLKTTTENSGSVSVDAQPSETAKKTEHSQLSDQNSDQNDSANTLVSGPVSGTSKEIGSQSVFKATGALTNPSVTSTAAETNVVNTFAEPQEAMDAPAPGSKVAILPSPGVPKSLPDGVIYIDNDEQTGLAQVETFDWQEVPDEAGRTHITTGVRFPVKVISELNSKTARVGDVVEGRTKVDIAIGGRLIAAKDTRVIGHVFSAQGARRMLAAETSKKRWFRANGELGIQFDEMITKSGEHIPLIAKPAKQSRIVENKNEGRIMGVNGNGEVASPLSIQLKHQAVHLAIRGAASAGGVFSFGAVPVAYGVLGAINPSFAYLHPVGQNVPHRRLKGFGMGFISGVPGGFLIADSIIKGVEASIKPGDEFLVEFKQDFTGEPAMEAELIPNADTKVHGEVVKKKSDKKK